MIEKKVNKMSMDEIRNRIEAVCRTLDTITVTGIQNAGNYLLTDDKAPVELLGMSVIDELIQNEVGYYREIFEEEGLSGLLDRL